MGFILRGILVPNPYANEQFVPPIRPEVSHAPFPSPTGVLPTTAWQTFTDGTLSIRYPGTWVKQANPAIAIADEQAVVLLTDGKGTTMIGNGEPQAYPSRFVGITSLVSSLSPSAYVDSIVQGFAASARAEVISVMNRRHYAPSEHVQAEVYTEPGAGGRGTIVLVSTGKRLYFITISTANPTDDTDINQILASISLR